MKLLVRVMIVAALLLFLACLWPARSEESTKASIFVGWLPYAVNVRIRFVNGGHTTYGLKDIKDITKELEAGLKCVQERKEK